MHVHYRAECQFRKHFKLSRIELFLTWKSLSKHYTINYITLYILFFRLIRKIDSCNIINSQKIYNLSYQKLISFVDALYVALIDTWVIRRYIYIWHIKQQRQDGNANVSQLHSARCLDETFFMNSNKAFKEAGHTLNWLHCRGNS